MARSVEISNRDDGHYTWDSMQVSEQRRALYAVLSVSVFGICLWHVSLYRTYVVDDIFINLRYAKNFIDGQGLVFNPGERVEGYTNICFVLLAALFLKLGIDPVSGLKSITLALAACTLWLTARSERMLVGLHSEGNALPLSVLLLLPIGAFVYWALCPMGTMLFTAVFLAALLLSLHERAVGGWRGSGLAFVLLALARPEGVYAFAICTAVLALIDYVRDRNSRHLWRHAANVLIFGVLFGAYAVWRYRYFGNLLPNTFYAKVTGGSGHVPTGLAYVAGWLRAFPLFGTTLLLPLLFAVPRMRRRLAQPVLVLVVYLIATAYVLAIVAIGGDFMPFFRFFIPIMPLSALLAVCALRAFSLSPRARGRLFAALLTGHFVCSLLTEQPYRAFVAHRTAVVGKRVGSWFASQLESEDVIAVNTAGSLPYYAGLPTIDMLGLTDAKIARRPVFITSKGWAGHRRGWGTYVLRRRPRVILWYNSAGSAEPFYLSDHELADHPMFRFFYQLRAVTLPAAGDRPARGMPIKRFLGFPFGFSPSGKAPMANLGLQATFREGIVDLTTFAEGPIRLTYFEFDRRDEDLWKDGVRLGREVRRFVDTVSDTWARSRKDQPAGDPTARVEVEALCAEAYRFIQGRDYARARTILNEAASRNTTARSPLVYQYITNLAVISGHLLTAVGAQKEALRLTPENRLYRENLHHLLTVPLGDLDQPSREAG